MLVQNGGRLLEKNELMKELWPDSFVEEGNLSFNVSTLRKALGDDHGGQRYIETVPKRGYRFVAPIRELTGEKVEPGAMEEKTSGRDTCTRLEEGLLEKSQGTNVYNESLSRAVRYVRFRWQLVSLAVLASLVVVVATASFFRHRANLKWARDAVTRVETLAQLHRYFEAYDLTIRVQKYLSNDSTIARLMPTISDDLSVSTEPSGARVYLKRFSLDAQGKFPPRQWIGNTPITHLRIARGEYLMYIEKDGYGPIERTLSSALNRAASQLGASSAVRIEQKLIEASRIPEHGLCSRRRIQTP